MVMATYKVIQDIEAEDKLLGPLTLRQFVYAAVVVVMGFICFKLIPVNPFLVIPFLPPMVFFAMLAAPFGHDQPSEVWMLAKFRFFLKPRRRIWNQDGMQELVTITVPKRIERHLTNGLNQYEVKSRLQALASTLDSRGWAIKNVSVNMFSQPSYLAQGSAVSDRLVDVGSLPQEVPNYEVYAADDIMDEQQNPTAQNLNTMINQSQQVHRQAAVDALKNGGTGQAGQPPADYWFMNQSTQPPPTQPGYATFNNNPVVFPGMDDVQTLPPSRAVNVSKDDEEKLLDKIHAEKSHPHVSLSHLKTVKPLGDNRDYDQVQADVQAPVATYQPVATAAAASDDNQGQAVSGVPANPAILRLANNDDLNVATLAREAQKAAPETLDNEVTISLR